MFIANLDKIGYNTIVFKKTIYFFAIIVFTYAGYKINPASKIM